MHASRRIYWVPIILIMFFLFDGVMMKHFSHILIEAGYSLVPRTVVIGLVLLTFLIDDTKMFWFALLVGFMYDSYYAGIIGVYMAIFAIIIRFIWAVKGNISINPFTLGLALIFLLTITEVGVYFVYRSQGLIQLTWQQFLVQRLSSSLVLNIVLYYIYYFPLKKFAMWINEAYQRPLNGSLRASRSRRY